MQAEINLPLKPRPALSSLIYWFFMTVWNLGIYVFLIAQGLRLRLDPSTLHQIFLMGILWGLAILFQGWLLVRAIRQRLAPPPVLRLTHEGICFPAPVHWTSHEGICFPVLIRWDEIKAIYPYTAPGSVPVVGIVLWSYEALLARSVREHSPGPLRCYFIRLNARILLGNPGYLAQVNIPQRRLPISIDELMSEIRTRFAAELHEHRITVIGWQD